MVGKWTNWSIGRSWFCLFCQYSNSWISNASDWSKAKCESNNNYNGMVCVYMLLLSLVQKVTHYLCSYVLKSFEMYFKTLGKGVLWIDMKMLLFIVTDTVFFGVFFFTIQSVTWRDICYKAIYFSVLCFEVILFSAIWFKTGLNHPWHCN